LHPISRWERHQRALALNAMNFHRMDSSQTVPLSDVPKPDSRSSALRGWRVVARVAGLLIATLAVIIFGQHLLARPDLSGFEPAELGRLESGMWRSYYEERWFRLGAQTLEVACGQYRFSWWDGARIATHAALSAAHFRTRTDDPRCLPELECYYRIIERAAPARFDASEAARLELAWWTERRKKVPTHDYSRTIARLTALNYGIPEADTLPAARLRAEAMAYRDERRDGRMTEADWNELTRQLRAAYAALHAKLKPQQEIAP